MVNPAHIHITSAPHTRNENVLKTNAVSSSTPAACATAGRTRKTPGTRCRLPQGWRPDADAKEYSLASSTVTFLWTRGSRSDAIAGTIGAAPLMSL